VLDEGVEQRVGTAIAAVLARVVGERFAHRVVHMRARQEIRHADRKADDVAAFGLEPLGFVGNHHDRAGLGATDSLGEFEHLKSSKKDGRLENGQLGLPR